MNKCRRRSWLSRRPCSTSRASMVARSHAMRRISCDRCTTATEPSSGFCPGSPCRPEVILNYNQCLRTNLWTYSQSLLMKATQANLPQSTSPQLRWTMMRTKTMTLVPPWGRPTSQSHATSPSSRHELWLLTTRALTRPRRDGGWRWWTREGGHGARSPTLTCTSSLCTAFSQSIFLSTASVHNHLNTCLNDLPNIYRTSKLISHSTIFVCNK